MDIPFLKLMSEAYVSDSNSDLNINDVSTYLLTSFGKFKIAYPEVVKELYAHSRTFQQDLIYLFLDKTYLVEDEIDINVESEYIDEASQLFQRLTTKLRQITNFRLRSPFYQKALSLSPEQQFMMSVIEKNYSNCNRSCSNNIPLSPEQLSDLLYINPYSDPGKRTSLSSLLRNASINIVSLSKCIRICYLDYMTSVYAEGIFAFESCVKNLNGSQITISNYSDMLRNYPVTGMCNEIYITLNDLYKEIDQLLDYVYLKDSFKKKQWLDIIFLKLDAYRQGRSYKMDHSKIDDEFQYPGDNVRIV
jgi:hypothetical protein